MQRFKNILFFAHGADSVSSSLLRAAGLAESNQARLTLVDVIEPVETPAEIMSNFNVELIDLLKDQRQQVLEQLVESINTDHSIIYTKVLQGLPFAEVIKFVQKGDYDLLIKEAEPPPGIGEKLFGSLDLHLLRKCPCPVLIDRAEVNEHYQHIIGAVDTDHDQEFAQQIIQLATSLAQRENASVDIISAWHLPGESMFRGGRFRLPSVELESMLRYQEQTHQNKLDKILEPFSLSVDDNNVQLVKGRPIDAINETAQKTSADIIVMGTVGRVGIPGLLIGNTAEEVLQTASCSVLAIKPAGFDTPVK